MDGTTRVETNNGRSVIRNCSALPTWNPKTGAKNHFFALAMDFFMNVDDAIHLYSQTTLSSMSIEQPPLRRITMHVAILIMFILSCHTVLAFSWSTTLNSASAASTSVHYSTQTRTRTRTPLILILFASNRNNDDNIISDNLLEKARRLREEVSVIESSKLEIQKEQEAKQREQDAEESKLKEEMNIQRMRYSVEVPILKDMGDEVMERVDFPPRLKGGEYVHFAMQYNLMKYNC